MSDAEFVKQADPDEIFALLSNDTRVAILRTLWAIEADVATFSELREAVGMRDSGQFNYHLTELVGPFLTRTEAGYKLTQAGMQINGAIEAGAYTTAGSFDPIALPDPCPPCGGDRTLHYEDDTVRVECDSCPVSFQIGVPPAVFAGYDHEAIPRVAGQYLQTTIYHITNGFCSFCDGPVAPTVTPACEVESGTATAAETSEAATATADADWLATVPLIQYTCHQCGAEPTVGLAQALLTHPAVVSFYYDHGVNVQAHSVWDLAEADPDQQCVRSQEPFRASVTYTCAGETLTLVVDESLTVVEIER